MKKCLLVSLIFLLPIIGFSQEVKDSKSDKKALKQKESEEQLEELYNLVESRKFIVEATQVYGDQGDVYDVMPSVNFFAVDSVFSTIQLSFFGIVGWNGIGGVTVDGKIDRFDLEEFASGQPISLNGSINLRSGGNAQFMMYVYSSGMANVTVTGNWGSNITFQGRLFTLAASKFYKGIPTN